MHRREKGNGKWRILGTILLIGLLTCAMLACFAAVYIQTVIMPQTKLKLTDFSMDLTTNMYYTDSETGEDVLMQTLHGSENRIWIKYDEIPKDLVNAAVAIEDKRFYDHHGVDWIRTMKGVINMFTGQDIQGGSTLTQQLIKNLTTQDEVTVKRKITEIFRALEFEKQYSKQQILEWYLNYIYLGEGCSGVYTASYAYFGKDVSQLTLAECASLIGITNNPSLYNPFLHPDKNKERQELILSQMLDQGYITQEQYDEAVAQQLVFVSKEDNNVTTTVYSWYEDQVIDDVIQDLADTYNMSKDAASDLVYSGGLEIYSCYNPDVQAAVDDVYLNSANLNYTSASGQQMQSAITIVDNSNGAVVAIAGGVGEKTNNRSWSRASDSLRQPGSSIKPLSVYSPALEMGLITPATVVDDSPYTIYNGSPWPVNSFGSYRGLTTVMEGLQNSVNTIAVRIMGDYVTPQASYDFLTQRYGITSLVESETRGGKTYSDIGLAQLALGGLTDGVSTYEMAGAYSTFARNGVYTKPHTYTKVVDGSGNVLLENISDGQVVLKDSTVYYINAMLENVVKQGTGTAANFSGMTVAGKTGTTTSRKDLWFVGYTPYYTAAVWTGYDQQERVSSSLGNPSAKLFKQVMSEIHQDLPNKDFQKPTEEIQTVSICRDSGLLPTQYCAEDARGSRIISMNLLASDVPTEYCDVHTELISICTVDGNTYLAGEFCPAETVSTFSPLNFTRVRVGNVSVADDPYLASNFENLTACPYHTEEGTQEETGSDFDINDPSTWPDDPDFDPNDSTTWPTADETTNSNNDNNGNNSSSQDGNGNSTKNNSN